MKKGTKKYILIWGLLFVPLIFWAQATAGLETYRITVFEDAVRIGQKGIVRFDQQRATIPVDFPVDPAGADLIASGDFAVSWFRFRQDTITTKGDVRDWTDILRTNISQRVLIVYAIGAEYDEIGGDIRWVDEEKGYMLLRGEDNSDYFIPLDQIAQVIVDGFSSYKVDRPMVKPVLEVRLTKEAPFVPLELFSLQEGIFWEPVCRIRILNSERAVLEKNALVINELADFKEIEVEISPGRALANGQLSGDITDLGKMDLQKGDRLLVNFQNTELEYQQLYSSNIPWTGPLSGRLTYPTRKLMRFQLPVADAFSCANPTILDENNRVIANINLEGKAAGGMVEFDLGEAKPININVVEVERKRGKKVIKTENGPMVEVSMEGKVIVTNVGTQAVALDLSRELAGEVTGTSGGELNPVEGRDGIQSLSWTVNLDPGVKKELKYKYEALVPAE